MVCGDCPMEHTTEATQRMTRPTMEESSSWCRTYVESSKRSFASNGRDERRTMDARASAPWNNVKTMCVQPDDADAASMVGIGRRESDVAASRLGDLSPEGLTTQSQPTPLFDVNDLVAFSYWRLPCITFRSCGA